MMRAPHFFAQYEKRKHYLSCPLCSMQLYARSNEKRSAFGEGRGLCRLLAAR